MNMNGTRPNIIVKARWPDWNTQILSQPSRRECGVSFKDLWGHVALLAWHTGAKTASRKRALEPQSAPHLLQTTASSLSPHIPAKESNGAFANKTTIHKPGRPLQLLASRH